MCYSEQLMQFCAVLLHPPGHESALCAVQCIHSAHSNCKSLSSRLGSTVQVS